MDWANEHWVKLYTRSTPDWNSWPWQSRALMPLLFREVDKAGQIGLGRFGVSGLAATVRLPVEVVEAGLDGLMADGCVTQVGQVLTVENFVEAQEARTSDKIRQQNLRDRRNLLKTKGAIVTRRHTASRSDESRGEESRVEETLNHSVASPPGPAELLFDYWRKSLRPKATVFDARTRKAVEARLEEGFSLDDLTRAVDGCKASPHHMGANDRGKRYDSLELICRDGGKVQQFHGYLEKGQTLTSQDIRSKPVRAEDQDHTNIPIGRLKFT